MDSPSFSNTYPNEGYNIISYEDLDRLIILKFYDISGNKETRDLWNNYYDKTDAIVLFILIIY